MSASLPLDMMGLTPTRCSCQLCSRQVETIGSRLVCFQVSGTSKDPQQLTWLCLSSGRRDEGVCACGPTSVACASVMLYYICKQYAELLDCLHIS